MIPSSLSALANHLWQSTLFAAAAGLLTLVLRKNPARVRHWIWMAASVKFLMPFAVFTAVGGLVEWRTAPAIAPSLSVAIDQVSQPFTMTTNSSPLLIAAPTAPSKLPEILLAIWTCGFIGVSISWFIRWRRIAAAVHAGSPVELGLPIRAISSHSFLEPGVFGVFRPVLLLPDGIFEHLSPEQWKSVLAHELCHIRRRDNLIGVLQMFVETVFWFHPLVWWIGKRIFEERERACDEEVLRQGSEPAVYARGILRVCELYLESPVECVAGITGANLRRRIAEIMENRRTKGLDRARKILLAGAGLAAVVCPLAIGILNAPAMRAQARAADESARFEVASLRLHDPKDKTDYNRPDAPNQSNIFPLNRYTMNFTLLKSLIANAYGVRSFEYILGGPDWLNSQHYDISAKVEGNTRVTWEQMRPMLRNLLKDRFHLMVHTERRMVPGYSMVIAKGGSKLKPNKGAPFLGADSGFEFKFQNASTERIAQQMESAVKQPVIDKTGLAGTYDFDLMFTREDHPNDVPHPDHGSIFTAIQEQLGLKLVSEKVPVDYLVIDHVDRVPTPN